MKKQFYPRTSSAGLFRRISLISLIAGGILVILLIVRFVFPDTFFFLAAPLWKAGDAGTQTIDQFFGGLRSKQTLVSELSTAEQERDTLFQENQTLQAQLDDIQKTLEGADTEHITVLAGVIARPPVSPYDTLTISLPVSYSPNNGTLVVGAGGAPLGTIAEVSGVIAQVSLFSSKGRETEGWVGDSRTPITLTGTGTGSFESTLPATATVAQDDSVYLPGPGALYLGKVVRVTKDDTTQKLHLFVRSSINPFTISSVGIIKP